MPSDNWRSREARERGEAALGKHKSAEGNYRSITRRADEENRLKTERLRTLRLAKEAADREAMDNTVTVRKKRAPRKSAASKQEAPAVTDDPFGPVS